MGHLEPGGAAEPGDAAAVRVERAWALWRRLKTYFPAWSLLPSAFITPGAWTLAGIDFIGGLRRNRSTRQTFALLKDTPPEDFEAVSALAAVNARRQELISRTVLLLYVTIPLTLLATGAEIAPDSVERLIRENLRLSLYLFFAATGGAMLYLSSWWRSKQMMSVLDLGRIERGMLPNSALELRDGD